MTRYPLAVLLLLVASAGCLDAPPAGDGGPPGDGAPPSQVRVLGVFAKDVFTFGSSEDDLALAIGYRETFYLVHLAGAEEGLAALLQAAEIIELPFAPVAMTGADVNGDNLIDLVAVSADGVLAFLANTGSGLAPLEQEVVVDDGAPLHDVTSLEAPDLAGEERIFVGGRDGLWKSDPLDSSGEIRIYEISPRLTGLAPPALFWATHDDVSSWYVGLAHGTAVDLWAISGFDRVDTELIGYGAPALPAAVYWRQLPAPARANFFAILPDRNQVVWVSEEFGASEETAELDISPGGPLRDLTVTQQPDGFDLVAISDEADRVVGVVVVRDLSTTGGGAPTIVGSAPGAIDTTLPIWVQTARVTAAPFLGKEILVLDQAGHIGCLEFDEAHEVLSGCGEADLGDYIAAWTEAR